LPACRALPDWNCTPWQRQSSPSTEGEKNEKHAVHYILPYIAASFNVPALITPIGWHLMQRTMKHDLPHPSLAACVFAASSAATSGDYQSNSLER
jgi:hypothetical protein